MFLDKNKILFWIRTKHDIGNEQKMKLEKNRLLFYTYDQKMTL